MSARDPLAEIVRFDEFELDESNARLTRRGEPIQLPPKAFAVLCTLARQAGRLISKDALLDAVWGHRHVTESVLKTTISQLRAALSDDPGKPRYIETIARRGYRFMATPAAPAKTSASPQIEPGVAIATPTTSGMIGRRAALARLHTSWRIAMGGQRQVFWVAGDAGVGKTTLIETFVGELNGVLTARGQCVEQFGTGEPYLPVLEALGSLCHRVPELPQMLRAIAPTWFLQLPWLSGEAERTQLHRELTGTNQDRMVREMAELMGRFTAKQPLVFVTEDLHWSDQATLRLLDHCARRREPIHLLWLATFRLTQIVAENHPMHDLRQELRLHRLCDEVVLDPFSEVEVAEYVRSRAPSIDVPDALVQRLHNHTEGLPLFVANVVETLLAQDSIEALPASNDAAWSVPENLSGAIEKQIGRLAPDVQAMLEAASVCGVEFRASTVADALGRELAWVSEQCDGLVRRQYWLRHVDVQALADGTLDSRYAFRHALYRHVFYERTGLAARGQLHRRVAAALERGRELGLPTTPAELASHFEAGLVIASALRYYAEAARSALSHFSPTEAVTLTGHALELLRRLPAGAERTELELALLSHRGVACSRLLGMAAPETMDAYERVKAICYCPPLTPARALLLNGLGWVHYTRGEYAQSLDFARRVHAIAVEHGNLALLIGACSLIGVNLSIGGELKPAIAALEQGIDACNDVGGELPHEIFVLDPGVMMRVNLSVPLLHLGFLDQSRKIMDDALERASSIGQPMAHMVAMWCAAMLEMRMRHPDKVAAYAQSLSKLVAEAGIAQGEGPSRWVRGWAEAYLGDPRSGHARILEGYRFNERLGMLAGCAEVLGYAVEALLISEDWEAARKQADEALALARGYNERLLYPYLLVLRGRAGAGLGELAEARQLIKEGIAEARAMSSVWHELKSSVALCELANAGTDDYAQLEHALGQVKEGGADVALCVQARDMLAARRPQTH